jgi:DNA-3-methyladenine glycosylase II
MRQRRPPTDPWAPAVAHLRASDPRWPPLIARVGPCRLRPQRDRFRLLVRAIIGQQISTKAAASIEARLHALAGTPFEPAGLLALDEPSLRQAGLSARKAAYVRDLAAAVHHGRLSLSRIGTWNDQAIVERLTEVKGIGRWTAEMFLIFGLNRPDVLPVTDLGIRVALRRYFDLPDLPTPAQCEQLAEPWRPHRTVAMWYLWRHLDTPLPAP